MNYKTFLSVLILAGLTLGCTATHAIFDRPYAPATYPVPRMNGVNITPHWLARCNLLSERAKKAQNTKVIFIGDSITELFETRGKNVADSELAKYNPLFLGISGDRTENVLFRLLKTENFPENIQPDAIVLLIGTNNLGHRADATDSILTANLLIVDLLREMRPHAKIFAMGIFPRCDGAQFQPQIDTFNPLFEAELAKRKNVEYVNINAQFLDKKGTLPRALFYDGLHPTEAGYRIWANELIKRLDTCVKF